MSAGPADRSLAGRRALITGGGRGIGRAIAEAYAAAGADIVVVSRTSSDLEAVVEAASQSGVDAMAVSADVTDQAQIDSLFEQVGATGGIDIAVLNAGGIPAKGAVEGSDVDLWRSTLDLNFFASYLCARAAIPQIRERGGGKIILVGSGLGHRGLHDYAAYSCAKAAQWMLTRVLGQELAGEQIAVNEIVPGPVRTTIETNSFDTGRLERFSAEWAKEPGDVVPLALMLARLPDHGTSAQSFSLMRRDG